MLRGGKDVLRPVLGRDLRDLNQSSWAASKETKSLEKGLPPSHIQAVPK